MRKMIFGIVAVAVLALICSVLAVACVKNTYQLYNTQSDFAFIADPGSSEYGASISAIKEGESRTYDVYLHNGYNRDTLKVYADGKEISIAPNPDYKEKGVELHSGYQVVGSVTFTAVAKDIDISFECSGKEFDLAFEAAGDYSSDARLDMFRLDGAPLKDYLYNGKKLNLNYDEVKSDFTFDINGPVVGSYSFQNYFDDVTHCFLKDGDFDCNPQVNAEGDLYAYKAYFLPDGLTEAGKTLTVDLDGLDLNDWAVENDTGLILTSSENEYFPANVAKNITLTLDTSNEFVDLTGVKLYINDTAVEMTNGSYTFNTGRFSPAAFIDQSNLSVAYTTLYKVRIEGAKIDMGAGTPFVKVEGKAENETVLVEPTEKMLYKDAEGQDNMFYDSVPYYTDGNVWYFMADDGLADIAINVNFSGIPDRSLYYILEVKYEENGGATDNAGFDLTGADYVREYGDTDSYYVHLSSKKEIISLYACITMASGAAPNIIDSENCYQVILCFSASAGSSISGVFR